MKVDFLKRGKGFRVEFDFDEDEIRGMEQVLEILPSFASRNNIEPARQWARIFREINGHRFVANGVRMWWMDELLEEGLILEADTEEQFNKLIALDRRANGDR